MSFARFRFTLPLLSLCSFAVVFSSLSLSQDKGDAAKGKAARETT